MAIAKLPKFWPSKGENCGRCVKASCVDDKCGNDK